MSNGQDSNRATPPGKAGLLSVYMAKRDDLIRYFAARLRSREAAEDLIQDLFVRLNALETEEIIDNPSGYLFRLANNMMLDRLRSAQRSGARDEAWRQTRSEDIGGFEVADEASPEQATVARQRLNRTLEAINSLPPRMRRAFELHRLEGMTQEQTAQALGVSRKTVEKQISSALKHLLGKLKKVEQ